MHAWFLIIALVHKLVGVFVCVCLPPRLLITSDMIRTLCEGLNYFYSFCVATIVGIVSSSDLKSEAHHRNQPNKSKLHNTV